MANDILESVRDEILKEDEKALPWVPKSLDKTWEMQLGFAGAMAGAAAGFALGAHMGLAGPWGAIAGTIPCTIVGGVVGYFSGAKYGSTKQRDWSGFGGSSGNDSANRIAGSTSQKQSNSNKFAPVGQEKVKFEDPAIVTKKRSLIIDSSYCGNCGVVKSVYWNHQANKCTRCGKGPKDRDIDGRYS